MAALGSALLFSSARCSTVKARFGTLGPGLGPLDFAKPQGYTRQAGK